MRSLQELGLAGEDDDEWMAALASPVDRFLEETRLSVRAYSALDRVADDLGARTLRQLCTRQADALLRRRAGRRGWREVVDALADWLEQRTDDPDPDAELEEPAQASLFGPPRPRVVPAPLPPPGDAGSLVSWAEGMKIADLLNQPISQALPSNVLALLPAPPDSRLLDVLSASPRKSPSGPGRPPLRRAVAISGILRDFVGHHLNAVSENRRVQAEREAAHPRVSGTAEAEPFSRFRDALVAARAALGAGQPRPPGTYLPEISYAEEPARLDYRESAGAQAGVPFVSHGPGSVQIHLAGWSARPLAAVCACRIGPDACEHRRAAFDAALDLLERPTLAAHQKLRAYLATPPWQRLLAQVERGLAGVALAARPEGERLAWVVRRRAEGTVTLAPIIQRHGARGWSKGATVSIADLARGTRSSAGAADARVIDILTSSAGPWGPSTLTDPAQVFRALEALIGTSNVYLEDRRDAPAAVRRVAPRVLVQETAAPAEYCFRFSLGDDPPCEPRVLLEVAADRRHALSIDAAANEVRLALLPPEVALLADALAREPATLPAEALEPVLARLERVQAVAPFELPPALVNDTVPADVRIVCQLEPMGEGGLALELAVRPLPEGRLQAPGEGAPVVFVTRAERRVAARRDLDAERRAAHAVSESLALPDEARTAPWRFALPDQEQALDLVVGLRDLGERVVVEWPQDAWRVESAGAGELRLRVTERRDWFGIEGGIEIDGQLVTLATLLDAVRRRRKYVTLGPGRFARIEDALRQRLGAADDSLIVSRGTVELGAAPELVADLVDDPANLEAIPSFHELRARRARAARHEPVLPRGLRATLRPYQKDGFEWLSRLAEAGAGACLADDMGLGKTLQTLAVLTERAPRGPALVLAPTSVVPNWLAEAERFSPDLRPVLYRGNDRGRLLADLRGGDLVVTSYAIAARDAEMLAGVSFATLVVDEAQALKNAQARRTHAVRSLKADWRLALTGTPVENHLGELWSLFRVVSPALLGGWEHFRERFAAPIERQRDPERRRALANLLRPFLLRRTKQEVAPELPGKTEITRIIDLSPAERRLYDAARAAAVAALTGTALAAPEDGKRRFQVLAALTRLRLLACHPRLFDETSAAPSAKVAALVELVSTLRETGSRALVFSQFVGFLELARQALDASGARTLMLHGGTPAAQRASLVADFQRGTADAFLISLKAGGTGLNLTEADTVIHLDPWWNPAVEDQATDRSHRIGQQRPVTVVRLVARATVEEAVIALHADKRALARAVLDGADGAAPLDTGELLALLQAGASDGAWDAGDDDQAAPSGPGDDADSPEEVGGGTLDLPALDALVERAMAAVEASRPAATAAQYRRALARFREFVSAGRALRAASWSEAGELFLSALRDKSWSAPASFYLVARTSLGHLQRAERAE